MILYRLVKAYANFAAIRGLNKDSRRAIRTKILTDLEIKLHQLTPEIPALVIQDLTFPMETKVAEKIMVIFVPQTNGINGGILSLFSIAAQMRKEKAAHGYEVVVMTLPSRKNETHFRNTYFRNDENIYRFSQISLCNSANEVYLHIPEYAAQHFCTLLSPQERAYLKNRSKLHINILNQNIKMMPDIAAINVLRNLSSDLSQSVAHHAYFSQDTADRYDLPTILLPAYTDLSAYPATSFSAKEKLIIYSPDEAPYKQQCLDAIARNCPEFNLVEIRSISFDKYMELATRCMFSITFGEGFDGYLAQPIQQGGIGFAVYNHDFFPTQDFQRYENIFLDDDQMVEGICDRIVRLSVDKARYEKLNQDLNAEIDKLYSQAEYINQIRKLALRQFEYFPKQTAGST